MKSLKILSSLLSDASRSLDVDMRRDWVTIQSRFQHEGLSFLTITLPAFSSWLEQSLEEGHLLPDVFCSFRKKKNTSAPCFLHGLVTKVFDKHTGVLLDSADATAVFFIRSVCNFFKKVKLPCTKARNDSAIEKFLHTDACLPEQVELTTTLRSVASVVVPSLRFFLQTDSLPKHGKGAVYEKLTGNRKYYVREFYERWSDVINPEDLYGWNRIEGNHVTLVLEEQEKPCRLSLVPKTLKSPRTIAVEPAAMQYAQQLCASRLIKSMAESKYTSHIDFSDQSVNRRKAHDGSVDRSLATIDLSEASDRVSCALVHELFSPDEDLRANLFAFRSKSLEYRFSSDKTPRSIPLRKFSTSGSAITFPVETLVFFMIALSAVVDEDPMSRKDLLRSIRDQARTVNVYGDDIIVPARAYSRTVRYLEDLGLKVNVRKSFSKGFFRESCGGDYFKGYDVTPTYLRQVLPDSITDAEQMSSSVATCNILFQKGCWVAADTLRQLVDLVYKLPVVRPTCAGLGWWSLRYEYQSQRILPNNWPGVRTLVPYVRKKRDVLSGYPALLKHFLSKEVQEDKDHLLETAPRYSMQLRVKWTPAF